MPERINHLAVWVAAVVYFLWGWLWFTIFGAAWHSMVPTAGSP